MVNERHERVSGCGATAAVSTKPSRVGDAKGLKPAMQSKRRDAGRRRKRMVFDVERARPLSLVVLDERHLLGFQ